MNIRQLILENELKLLQSFPEYSKIISAFMTKIEKFTFDSNVVDFCLSTFDNNRKRKQLEDYRNHGFLSCLDIIKMNKDLIDNRRFETDDLEVGNMYNSFDISSIALNFNYQRGMYQISKKNSEYIVKATIRRGILAKIPYENRWIKDNESLKYYFQSETNLSSRNVLFSHKANNKIYDDFIKKNYHIIHVFYRYDDSDYIYDGIYYVVDADLDEQFIIIKKIDEFSSLEDDYLKTVLKTITSKQNLKETIINVIYTESDETITKKTIKTRKTDYEIQYSKNLEIGEIGEEQVLNYEKNRLLNAGKKEYADKVKRVSLESDNYGYDIQSYDFDDNGVIKEIHIEVKTTANNQNTPFFISKNELEYYNDNLGKSRIYRVYNALSRQPLFYRISDKNLDAFEINTHIYSVKIKRGNYEKI